MDRAHIFFKETLYFFHSHKWIDLSGNWMGLGWSGYLGVAEGKKCQIGNVKSSSSPFPFNEY